MKRKIILFGNIPLATKILMLLLSHVNADVEGVVCEKKSVTYNYHYFVEPCVYDYATERNIPIFDLDELANTFSERELFLGFSGRYPKILNKNILNLFSKGVINCHGGPLPKYRGVNISNHVILNNESRSTGTLHYMREGIDTGPIIGRMWFPIEPDDTAYNVFCKTQQSLWDLIQDNIDSILEDRDEGIEQELLITNGESVGYYKKTDLDKYRKVKPDYPTDYLYRVARAFDFPEHEPAYFEHNGKKIYLTTTLRHGDQ